MKLKPLGLQYYDPSRAYNGYTLFSPWGGKDVWLIDMRGRFVHRWQMPYMPGVHGRLLPNGNLLYAGKDPNGPVPDFGGCAGHLLEMDWNGNITWQYDDAYMSHDFFRMDNGNTMVLKWTPIPADVAGKVQGGIPGTEREGLIWSDVLHEVNPDGEVVWEWLAYEHLDPEIDVIQPLDIRDRWGQANACYVMPNGNIIVSYAFLSQIQIIEKATGNVLWRYGHGDFGEGRRLGFQHNPTYLDNGNILLHDNGRHRPIAPDYSRVIEVNPETNQVEWEYVADPPHEYYGSFMGGAQRLPNGNTLICEAPAGRLFEVTPGCEIVWEYVNPFYNALGRFGHTNMLFRGYRYGSDYSGLKGTGLDDINLLYGPESIGSEASNLSIPVTPWVTEDKPAAPGLGSSSGDEEAKMQARMERLGY